jgi:acyl-CoA synthetase (AMP-forming)/AMP-acid ligase II
VSLVAGNAADYPVALLGTLAAGATAATANPALTASELARQFARSQPRIVIADGRSVAAAREGLAATVLDAPVYLLDGAGGGASLADLLTHPGPAVSGRDPGDLAYLFPSSGTTGQPKLAAHTHASATAWLQAFATVPSMQFTRDDVVACIIPFTHLYGAAVLTHTLRGGANAVTLGVAGFELEAFLRMLHDHAATVATVTPPVMLALAHHPLVDRFDLGSLRLVITGAAPCAPEVQDAVATRLGCPVADMLGSTEAWCYAQPGETPARGSVGVLGPNLEAVLADPETGAWLGTNQTGELWIRGPHLMARYLGDDGAIAATLDADGWLRTGDLCTFDARGNLFIVDRLKELLKVGGYSVAPAELERELSWHPAVADAGVVGRSDPLLGQVPVAYVALRDRVDAAELRAWLATRLAPWKQVRDVVMIDRIPRSPAGKVLRRELLEREPAQSVG